MTLAETVARYPNRLAAARALNIAETTLRRRLEKEAKSAPVEPVRVPKLPRHDVPIATVIRRLADGSHRADKRAAGERWYRVHVSDTRPIGVLWFGDPHLGTSTNWKRLERDVALCVASPGLYGANIGDTTNNWTGRLAKLYADEDISRATERRLAKWFLADAGITWLAWLMGNHDAWEHGADILKLMDIHNRVPMVDWAAKFEIVFAGKTKVRIHAAHDFPGHSMWNPTHAPARAPRMLGSDADLYVCGHRHDWGIQQFEMAEREKCPVSIRVRGYKRNDDYARRNGYQQAEHGAAIMTIIDPTAAGPGRVLPFVDVDQGARVLAALRGGK
jgi:hypothetical protein